MGTTGKANPNKPASIVRGGGRSAGAQPDWLQVHEPPVGTRVQAGGINRQHDGCPACRRPLGPGEECPHCRAVSGTGLRGYRRPTLPGPDIVEIHWIEPVSYAKVLSVLVTPVFLPIYLLGMSGVRHILGLHLSPGAGWGNWRALALYAGIYVVALCGGLIYNFAASWTGGIQLRISRPLPVRAKLYEVRQLSALSGLKLGAVAGVYLGIVTLAASLLIWAPTRPVSQPVLWLLPVWLGMGLALAGMLGCVVYSLLADVMGGVRVKLS